MLEQFKGIVKLNKKEEIIYKGRQAIESIQPNQTQTKWGQILPNSIAIFQKNIWRSKTLDTLTSYSNKENKSQADMKLKLFPDSSRYLKNYPRSWKTFLIFVAITTIGYILSMISSILIMNTSIESDPILQPGLIVSSVGGILVFLVVLMNFYQKDQFSPKTMLRLKAAVIIQGLSVPTFSLLCVYVISQSKYCGLCISHKGRIDGNNIVFQLEDNSGAPTCDSLNTLPADQQQQVMMVWSYAVILSLCSYLSGQQKSLCQDPNSLIVQQVPSSVYLLMVAAWIEFVTFFVIVVCICYLFAGYEQAKLNETQTHSEPLSVDTNRV